jgi:enolase
MNTAIASVRARRVWDSRGRPTIEAEVALEGGARGRAIAPAGASRGSREAIDLRDGGRSQGGLDVTRAISHVDGEIAAALAGRDALDQPGADQVLIELDGTANNARLGGNATVAVSLAVIHAAAAARGLPLWRHLAGERPVMLPLPEIQIFGGGAHAGRRIDIQDLMVMPVGAASFADALAMTADVYRAAGLLMEEAGRAAGVADEGGHWPAFDTNEEALEMLVRAIERAGFVPGVDAAISLDIAASEFGRDGRYRLGLERRQLDRDAWITLVLDWLDRYPIASIEDPLAEDDRDGWIAFTHAAGARVQIIGDDYLTTNAPRVVAAAADGACNAVLLKPNQAGTVTETVAALAAARTAGFATIVSARSGETEDVTIAHLAVGWNAGQLKVGSFARGERMAKWNEVLRIEEALGPQARYASVLRHLRVAAERAPGQARTTASSSEAATSAKPAPASARVT